MAKRFPLVVREAFVELVSGGSTLRLAAAITGVSPGQAVVWWRESGHMSLRLADGPRGGLGLVPPDLCDPGRVRRPLSIDDRVLVAVGVHQGWSLQRIADAVGRDRSVVCREIGRNRSPDGVYRASVAHRVAAGRRPRPRITKLAANPGLCRRIEAWMDDGWSPRLISQVLAAEGAGDTERVSHETIYQALYVQTRGSLRADLHRLSEPETKPPQGTRHHPEPESVQGSLQDQRTSRRRSRPCRAGPLGGRPDHGRHRNGLSDRDAGGAIDPVHDLVAPARQARLGIGRRGDDPRDGQVA